jgi:Ca2+-binding EF-hand superfamily protein
VVDLLKFEDVKDEEDYRHLIKRKSTTFFNRLTADIPVEHKGTIALKEWIQFFDSEIVNGQDAIITDEFVDLILMFLFGFYNQNRDGYMTMDEYVLMFSKLGLAKTDLEADFKLFDANKDGRLSRYDLALSIEIFLTTNNEDDPSNWIFGRWDLQELTQ